MRPCAHHHQLESHICNLQPNPQTPLQRSKPVFLLALAVGLQIHATKRKNVSVDQLMCVKHKHIMQQNYRMQLEHCAGSALCMPRFCSKSCLACKIILPHSAYQLINQFTFLVFGTHQGSQ